MKEREKRRERGQNNMQWGFEDKKELSVGKRIKIALWKKNLKGQL